MKEHPILFSGEMVRAILAGTKTQTRRVIKPQPKYDITSPHWTVPIYPPNVRRLWVRETWQLAPMPDHGVPWAYRATEPDFATAWRPSIFMPRAASRLTLELTSVRVERVQDISDIDLIREGIDPEYVGADQKQLRRSGYQYLWDSLNAKRGYSWESNPWVFVLSFKRIQP